MDEFAVWLFLPDGAHLCEQRGLDAREAVALAHDLTRRPAALLGVIKRVIIVDDGDCAGFEWCLGMGVTYPPLYPAEADRDTEAGNGLSSASRTSPNRRSSLLSGSRGNSERRCD